MRNTRRTKLLEVLDRNRRMSAVSRFQSQVPGRRWPRRRAPAGCPAVRDPDTAEGPGCRSPSTSERQGKGMSSVRHGHLRPQPYAERNNKSAQMSATLELSWESSGSM